MKPVLCLAGPGLNCRAGCLIACSIRTCTVLQLRDKMFGTSVYVQTSSSMFVLIFIYYIPIGNDYKYTRYNLCSAWFLYIRISTC